MLEAYLSASLKMEIDQASAQVRIPPPLILVTCMLVGVGLHWIHPVHFIAQGWRLSLAILFIGIGMSISLYCVRTFKRKDVDVKPWKATSRLITTGIYRLSRNPIYLSFALVNLGIAFAADSLWIMLMTIPFIAVMDRYVIAKEERYLEHKVRAEYRAYQAQTRRWI